MKYIAGFFVGALMTIALQAHAGFFGSAIGGAVGASLSTSGLESKVDSINARIEALTRALDSVKVCK